MINIKTEDGNIIIGDDEKTILEGKKIVDKAEEKGVPENVIKKELINE